MLKRALRDQAEAGVIARKTSAGARVAELPGRLGLPETTRMRQPETLHLAGGRPSVLESRRLNRTAPPDR